MKHIFLVSCVKRKQCRPAPAKELYLSDLFKKSRKLVEESKCPWFILSAKHGLLHPDKVICRYDETLNQMPKKEREAWAERVKAQMADNLPDAETVVILAGERYCEFLMEYLEERFGIANVKNPMKGMLIGKRKAWLKSVVSRETPWSYKCQNCDEGDKQ